MNWVMRVTVWRGVLGLLAMLGSSVNGAEQDEQIAELIFRLGSSRFEEREAASRELLALGGASRGALQAARSEHPDAEVRARARRLLPAVERADQELRLARFLAQSEGDQGVPGWQAFCDVVGNSPQSRELFAKMHRAEPTLMMALDGPLADLSETLLERLVTLTNYRRSGAPREQATAEGICALLYFSGRVDFVLPDNLLSQLASLTLQNTMSTQATTGAYSPATQALLSWWIAREWSDNTTYSMLNIAARYDLKQSGAVVARRLLGAGPKSAHILQYALLTIARFGSRVDLALVEPRMTDMTVCMSFSPDGKKKRELQIRDVALAAAVKLSGQKRESFGWPAAADQETSYFNPSILIFAEDADRDAAHARWKQWKSESSTANK